MSCIVCLGPLTLCPRAWVCLCPVLCVLGLSSSVLPAICFPTTLCWLGGQGGCSVVVTWLVGFTPDCVIHLASGWRIMQHFHGELFHDWFPFLLLHLFMIVSACKHIHYIAIVCAIFFAFLFVSFVIFSHGTFNIVYCLGMTEEHWTIQLFSL